MSTPDIHSSGAWDVTVTGGHVEQIDNADHIVFDLMLTPPGGVEDLTLTYDGIVHHLLSHRIFVSEREPGQDTYSTVGVLDWQSQTTTVTADPPSTWQGFTAAVGLGVKHIAEGADHLLFLIMLLIPAPLPAEAGC